MNVLSALPASMQPLAKKMLAEIPDAEDKDNARVAAKAFADEFHARFPKAADKVTDDLDQLLAFYDFSPRALGAAEDHEPYRVHPRVGARTKVTKGAGSRAAGLAMAFKLMEAAQSHWRSVNGSQLVALVRAGATFKKGVLDERDQEVAA